LYAASESAKLATDSAHTQPASDSAELRTIRDRIASRVATLRKKDQMIVSGEIKDVTDRAFVVESLFGKRDTVKLDDQLTKYFKFTGSAREDLEKKAFVTGAYVVVSGIKVESEMQAQEVYMDEMFLVKAGRVVENDGISMIKIDSFEKEKIQAQIDKNTVFQVIQKDHLVAPNTLKKIKEGDTVQIVFRLRALAQTYEKVQATRILHIPATYFNQ
jgi:hypothetical protein